MKEFEIVTKIKLWSFEELHPNDRQLVEMVSRKMIFFILA